MIPTFYKSFPTKKNFELKSIKFLIQQNQRKIVSSVQNAGKVQNSQNSFVGRIRTQIGTL